MRYLNSLFIVLAGGLLAACQQPRQQSGQSKESEAPQIDSAILVSCEGIGPIKLSDSYEDLLEKLGPKVLTVHENTVVGKFTTAWENDPKQVNIYWEEKNEPFRKIRYIEAVNQTAPYMTADSIKIGASLRDLVARNGNMPVTFRNFYALDNAGRIVDFNKGDIPRRNPCLGGVLEWSGQTNIYKHDHDAFKKQEIVHSYENILQRMDIVLATLRVEAKQ